MKQQFKDFFQSKMFTGVLLGISGAIIVLGVFQAGVMVGYHRAAFSYHGGDMFSRFYDGGPGAFSARGGFPTAHGAIGTVVRITLPTFVVADNDGVEKTIVVTDKTVVRRSRDTILATDLKMGDTVAIIGSPNTDSQVEASLIRVLPPLPAPALMMPSQSQ